VVFELASADSNGLSSVQMNFLLTARLHRLDFYVVLRELIPKLQAFLSVHPRNRMRFCSVDCVAAYQGRARKERWGRYAVFNSVIRECPQPSMAGPEKKLRNVARSV
jgi:hypothetical protein